MADQTDNSFATLLSGALNDARELLRQEIALARFEIREEISRAVSAAIALAAGALVLLVAALFILTGCARGFARLVNWPIWAGFFVVGGVLLIAGLVAVYIGSSRVKQLRAVPPQTAETIKEDVQWLKQQTKSVRE